VPNQTIKIQTKDGNIFVYKISEVDKITKEPVIKTSIVKEKKITPAENIQSKKQENIVVKEPQKDNTSSLPYSYGVKGGLSFANMTYKDKSGSSTSNSVIFPGIFLGGYIEYRYRDNIILDGGLIYVQKGQKTKFVEDLGGGESSTTLTKSRLNYLEIPIHVQYIKNISGYDIYGKIGPYIGIGLGGEINEEITAGGDNETSTSKIVWGSAENSDFKKSDFGLSIGAGVKFGKIMCGFDYNFGLANIYPNPTNGEVLKNKFFGISVIYMLK
jgi:hypothetical protein